MQNGLFIHINLVLISIEITFNFIEFIHFSQVIIHTRTLPNQKKNNNENSL